MTTPARRERPMFAELVDWLKGGSPSLPVRLFAGSHVMPVEDYVEGDQYVLHCRGSTLTTRSRIIDKR